MATLELTECSKELSIAIRTNVPDGITIASPPPKSAKDFNLVSVTVNIPIHIDLTLITAHAVAVWLAAKIFLPVANRAGRSIGKINQQALPEDETATVHLVEQEITQQQQPNQQRK